MTTARALFETTLSRAGAKFVGVKADECIRICYAAGSEGRTTSCSSRVPASTRNRRNSGCVSTRGAALPSCAVGQPAAWFAGGYLRDADLGGRVDRVLLDSSGAALEADGRRSDARQTKPAGGRADRGFPIASMADAASRRRSAAAVLVMVVSLGAGRREDVRPGSSRSASRRMPGTRSAPGTACWPDLPSGCRGMADRTVRTLCRCMRDGQGHAPRDRHARQRGGRGPGASGVRDLAGGVAWRHLR